MYQRKLSGFLLQKTDDDYYMAIISESREIEESGRVPILINGLVWYLDSVGIVKKIAKMMLWLEPYVLERVNNRELLLCTRRNDIPRTNRNNFD